MVRPTAARMKSPVSNLQLQILVVLTLAGVAHADLPRKAPLQTYSTLWNNSPFTSKPPVESGIPEANPLEDYSLIGISPIGGSKYRVTLLNKKKPDERIMIFSDDANSEFKILGVTRKPGDPLGTVVSLSSGTKTGSVSFDEKLLTLAAPAPPKAAAPVPGQVPIPGQNPQLAPGVQRQPRPRVVPPPQPGQVPQPVPQQGQVPQAGQSPMPQPQPQNIQQQERPERRRN